MDQSRTFLDDFTMWHRVTVGHLRTLLVGDLTANISQCETLIPKTKKIFFYFRITENYYFFTWVENDDFLFKKKKKKEGLIINNKKKIEFLQKRVETFPNSEIAQISNNNYKTKENRGSNRSK